MEAAPTKVLGEPWEVGPRLKELGLTLEGLRTVAAVATAERANATPFHCANAAGTFAYQSGTYALRDQFVGKDGWQVDRRDGIEAIYNPTTGARVAFSNVDLTCDENHGPKPRSDKGAGAERACAGNLFPDLPAYSKGHADTFYLMVDEAGMAELTRPVIKGGTFSSYSERIFLYRADDGDDLGRKLSLDDSDAITHFDPEVLRKKR